VRVGVALAVALGALATGGARAGVVEPRLAAHLATLAPEDEADVIVRLAGRSGPQAASSAVAGRWRPRERAGALARSLRRAGTAARAAASVRLASLGARRTRELWAIGAVAARLRADRVAELAADPSVESVDLDAIVLAPEPPAAASASAPPGWNLDAVGAPALWALGHTGEGVVVASLDTGVDVGHPDLGERWRGGPGGWFDPHDPQHASTAPHDPDGHGTYTMGILAGSVTGMAPGARWIAAKLWDEAGEAQASDIHDAFQWLLDPDGDPETADAPRVVNASWGLLQAEEPCILEFAEDLALLRAAGIAVVFAAGNDGEPRIGGVSPGNNPGAFAVGATEPDSTVAGFSARGPSACGGETGTFPRLVAPGADITTTDRSFGLGVPLYTAPLDGTSLAAPHVAGALALLADAFPEATVDELEDALVRSARDLGAAGPDDESGAGLLDAHAAYRFLAARGSGGGLTTGSGCSSAGGSASLLGLAAAIALARASGRPRR
jgi:subtilisin family serine protease